MPGFGEIEITLGGRQRALVCSVRAARRVNGLGPGFAETLRRVGNADFDCYVAVIAAGLNAPVDEIETDVFRAGISSLVTPVSEYVAMLANGGRPPNERPDEGNGESQSS